MAQEAQNSGEFLFLKESAWFGCLQVLGGQGRLLQQHLADLGEVAEHTLLPVLHALEPRERVQLPTGPITETSPVLVHMVHDAVGRTIVLQEDHDNLLPAGTAGVGHDLVRLHRRLRHDGVDHRDLLTDGRQLLGDERLGGLHDLDELVGLQEPVGPPRHATHGGLGDRREGQLHRLAGAEVDLVLEPQHAEVDVHLPVGQDLVVTLAARGHVVLDGPRHGLVRDDVHSTLQK